MAAIFADVRKLGNSYTQLDRDGRSDVAGTLQQAVRQADDRYQALKSAMDDAEKRLSDIVWRKMNFDSNRETTLTWLRQLDKELKCIEASSVSQLEDRSTLKVYLMYWHMHLHCRDLTVRCLRLPCLRLSLLPPMQNE